MEFEEELTSGAISMVIGLVATYGVSMVYPVNGVQWALSAVGIASFFSGFFSSYYTES